LCQCPINRFNNVVYILSCVRTQNLPTVNFIASKIELRRTRKRFRLSFSSLSELRVKSETVTCIPFHARLQTTTKKVSLSRKGFVLRTWIRTNNERETGQSRSHRHTGQYQPAIYTVRIHSVCVRESNENTHVYRIKSQARSASLSFFLQQNLSRLSFLCDTKGLSSSSLLYRLKLYCFAQCFVSLSPYTTTM